MTIQVELLNKDQHRSVKVVYRDISSHPDKPEASNITESLAGVINPQESNSFWIHAQRELLIIENNETEPENK